jgi:hypothetical protein
MKQFARMFSAVILVLGLAGSASAKDASLSERELEVASWKCRACNMTVLTLSDFGRYMTNRKDKDTPVLNDLDKYLKEQNRKVKNFFTNSPISSCGNGSPEYNKAHTFFILENRKLKPADLVQMKDRLFYIEK